MTTRNRKHKEEKFHGAPANWDLKKIRDTTEAQTEVVFGPLAVCMRQSETGTEAIFSEISNGSRDTRPLKHV